MINYRECLDRYNINVRKVSYFDKYTIVDSDDIKYLLKKKDSNKKEVFDYLKQIDYGYYQPILNEYSDCYELYPYYDDNISGKYTKARELIYALALLHLKTTIYVDYSQDKIKEIYEDIGLEIDNLSKYYLDLQDYFEGVEFLSPGKYLLMKNISKIHYLLYLARKNLNNWFNNLKSIREVLLINNVSLNNFRVGERSYFVDFSLAKNGLVVYDLVKFYKSEVLSVDFLSLFSFYNNRYPLNEDEMELFYALISIPTKISFSKDNYLDSLNVRKLVDYVNITLNFISEKDKKYQETNEDKFEEENYNI